MTRIQRDNADELEPAEELELKLALLGSVLGIAADAIITIDEKHCIRIFNKGAELIFGYSAAEVLGKPVDILLPHRFGRSHREHVKEFADSPQSSRLMHGRRELIGSRKDGTEFPAEASIAKLEMGKAKVFTVILRDITEHKQAEKALHESEEQVRLLLNSTAEAIYGIDLEGNCTFSNPACAAMLGYESVEELVGKHMHSLMHHTRPDGTPYPPEECRIYRAFRKGEGTHVDDEVLWCADGRSFPAEYWSYPIYRHDQLIGAVVTFFDITKRKRLESELLRQERLVTLGQLTATVSHELRNPLGVIRTSAFIVQDGLTGETPRIRRALERIERNIIRCDRIIDELLDFTRISEIKAEPTAIDAWLEETLKEQGVPSGVALRRDFAMGDRTVSLDRDRFRRAIINVFDNACQAMIGEGREDTGSEEHTLTVRTQEHDGRAEVIFEDTGPGIPPDVYERIFEPLYSTKGFGVGLGLPVVKQIMEQHGGGIEIESEEGRGTRVCLWLPIGASTHRLLPHGYP